MKVYQLLLAFAALAWVTDAQGLDLDPQDITCLGPTPLTTVRDFRSLIRLVGSSATADSFEPGDTKDGGTSQIQVSGTAALLVAAGSPGGFTDVQNQLGAVFTRQDVATALATGPMTTGLNQCCKAGDSNAVCAVAFKVSVPVTRTDGTSVVIQTSLSVNTPLS